MRCKAEPSSTGRQQSAGLGSIDENRRLVVVEAWMFAVIAVIGAAITYELVRVDVPTRPELVVPGIIEAEALPVARRLGQFEVMPQDTSLFSGGRWSGNQHLFVAARSLGDALELELPSRKPGPYELSLYLTKSYDYGIVLVSVNDEAVGRPIDLWSWTVESTGPLRVGTVRLRGQGDVIRFEVAGRNDQAMAPYYQFGIDGLVLQSAPQAGDAQ